VRLDDPQDLLSGFITLEISLYSATNCLLARTLNSNPMEDIVATTSQLVQSAGPQLARVRGQTVAVQGTTGATIQQQRQYHALPKYIANAINDKNSFRR